MSAPDLGVLAKVVRGRPFSLLCGAGVSADSGLPTASGLHEVVRAHYASESATTLLESYLARRDGVPVLRFEGILDAMQRLVDPELRVLAPYRGGHVSPAHDALAALGSKVPVVTTNIDGLVERAARGAGVPLAVCLREADFGDELHAGLWKIHGSLSRFHEHGEQALAVDEDGGPVVTLTVCSSTRESSGRRRFLETLLRETVLIVAGYSSSDDFDVSRWLRTAENPEKLVWIQFSAAAHDQLVVPDARNPELDPGLRRVIVDWEKRGILERLTLILSPNPTGLLCDLAGVVARHFERVAPVRLSMPAPSPWQQHMLSGALLVQMSHYAEALPLLERALELAPDPSSQLLALVELADAECWSGQELFESAAAHARQARELAAGAGEACEHLAARARVVELNALRLGQPETRDQAAKELRALYERYGEHRAATLRAVAFSALVNLAQLERHRAQELPVLFEQRLESSGLLQPKAQRLHERAIEHWRSATEPAELDQALADMREAIDFRADVGDIPGLTASWNVLACMLLRRAWFSAFADEALLQAAGEAVEQSLTFAERHRIRFAVAQARLSEVVLSVRTGDAARAAASLGALKSMQQEHALDERSSLQLAFCAILVEFALARGPEALESASAAFDGVAREGVAKAVRDPRFERIGRAAAENAAACRAWSRSEIPALPDPSFLTPRPTELFDRRLAAFVRPLAEAQPLGQLLFDPLGP